MANSVIGLTKNGSCVVWHVVCALNRQIQQASICKTVRHLFFRLTSVFSASFFRPGLGGHNRALSEATMIVEGQPIDDLIHRSAQRLNFLSWILATFSVLQKCSVGALSQQLLLQLLDECRPDAVKAVWNCRPIRLGATGRCCCESVVALRLRFTLARVPCPQEIRFSGKLISSCGRAFNESVVR